VCGIVELPSLHRSFQILQMIQILVHGCLPLGLGEIGRV